MFSIRIMQNIQCQQNFVHYQKVTLKVQVQLYNTPTYNKNCTDKALHHTSISPNQHSHFMEELHSLREQILEKDKVIDMIKEKTKMRQQSAKMGSSSF